MLPGGWPTGSSSGEGSKTAVKSLSTILPFVRCGGSFHPGSETTRSILSSLRCSDFRTSPSLEIMVQLRHGQLRPLPPNVQSLSWMAMIRPARDRYEQNMELVRDSDGYLFLLPVKLILPGQELFVWYGEALARAHGVPIISPTNITNNGEYQCNACKSSFVYPNSLKSHILYDCRFPFTNLLITRCRPTTTTTPVFFQPWTTTSGLSTNIDRMTSPIPAISSNIGMFLCNDSRPKSIASLLPVQLKPGCDDYGATCDGESHHRRKKRQSRNDVTSGPDRSSFIQRMLTGGAICDDINRSSSSAMMTMMMTSHDDITVESETKTDQIVDGEMSPEVINGTGSRHSTTGRKRIRHNCCFCGKLYSRKYGLTIHLRTHSGHKPLKCRVCLRPFGDPSNLNKHVRLHGDGDTPYRCRHCGKVLVRKRDLERHIRSRHPRETRTDDVY